jgi:hypothetical protein
LLTGLTTCLFNHGPDNPLLQPVSTQFPQGEDNNNWSIQLRKTRTTSHTQEGTAWPQNQQSTHMTQTYTGCSGFTEDMAQSTVSPLGFRVRDKESKRSQRSDKQEDGIHGGLREDGRMDE